MERIADILRTVEHRPWPLPRRPWVMVQTWHDLLFAHWRIEPAVLRRLVPPVLELDLFDGSTWVAVTPFWMSGVRPRFVPPLPGLSQFPEMNVRTYVTLDRKPGVFFFSLDAANLPAVWSARLGYKLPYFHARMKTERNGELVRYGSARLGSSRPAEFAGRYRPISAVFQAKPGTLEHFLAERYCLYAVERGKVWRGDIHHAPWPLRRAEAEVEKITVAEADGVPLPDEPPHLMYAERLKVLIWWRERAR